MKATKEDLHESGRPLTKEEFIQKIKDDNNFSNKWGYLGRIYGAQWRKWKNPSFPKISKEFSDICGGRTHIEVDCPIDQISELIKQLKENPDSRRLMVNAWNVGELDQMVLPPCHYGFQVYTRELSRDERIQIYVNEYMGGVGKPAGFEDAKLATRNIPTRAISLMWNQRSVDTFLGLPFNIASYGLLLEIIAEIVNMVPDELIGNLGDVHLYSNHIEQAKEQIGRELTDEELYEQAPLLKKIRDTKVHEVICQNYETAAHARQDELNLLKTLTLHTRQPYSLPKLRINTEFWNPGTENGCGMGPGTYTSDISALINGFELNDFQIEDYQSHPTIKAPLSN